MEGLRRVLAQGSWKLNAPSASLTLTRRLPGITWPRCTRLDWHKMARPTKDLEDISPFDIL